MNSDARAKSSFVWLGCHLVAIGLLLAAPAALVFGRPVWALEADWLLGVGGIAGCYFLAAGFSTVGLLQGRQLRVLPAVAVLVVLLAGWYLMLLLGRDIVPYSRRVLLLQTVLALVTLALPIAATRYRVQLLVAMTVVLAGLISMTELVGDEPLRTMSAEVIHTARGPLEVATYSGYVKLDSSATKAAKVRREGAASRRARSLAIVGGGLQSVGGKYLLATGDGRIYLLTWMEGSDSLQVLETPLRVPMNREEFEADAAEDVDTELFRVTHVMTRSIGDSLRIVTSHHYWKRAERCFVLRVSGLTVSVGELTEHDLDRPWTEMYDTRPCLPIKTNARVRAFAGHQSGGRLADLGSEGVLLTVGDHQFDGFLSEDALPQMDGADYGKTLLIRPDGSVHVFTTGHRNPQGLHIDATGTIWLTEHGPEGGDELNRLVAGANYGWPFRTLGTQYGSVAWPLQGKEGSPTSFRPPVYAWVPSIAPSNLISIRRARIPDWQGDLLVSSLRAQSLHRLRVRDDRVTFSEAIDMGQRIRDLVEGPDGRIVLWTDDGSIMSVTPADGFAGAMSFSRCVACHITEERQAGIGPHLNGIHGRAVASVEGYPYSRALLSVDGKWTAERLDAFLEDPDRFAPGTTMTFEGIADAREREALIDYLKRF